MPLIEIKGASKGYGGKGSRSEILKDINLSIEQGEFVVIVGYSGSGKSTLINLISGLVKPDSGVATIAGETITGPGPDRGLVFQNYSLLPWLTVEENIALAVDEVFKDWTPEQRKEHVNKFITMVKLGHASHKLPKELSGGMRQRVSVARTLAMNPKVLLLDEPLSALDALTRAQIQDEISEIWRENLTTVLWITNDPDEALLLADRVIPLLPTAPATLGEPILVDLERPRDRRTLNHDPKFKKLRSQLIGTLLDAKGRNKVKSAVHVTLPDILPEDLTTVNSLQFLNRSGPKRRGDNKREEVEVAA
ncbi:ABC transporter ATP-binding protein [Prosthecobacter vanneervenii]|uniref:Nitrate/nitrite transport system ATP-binding protein n=1 Tax=Prosthecobacter vanneervenii TaxID=48466 RepID=A0A7W7Y8L2_9BACT|nr:ABC transporter ATP-binding protein [Prosthecobacter vanneervenii]MBB5031643.1 nitrate/nitrite transport system ATP-binding protein [Prosthecobacter vanneervenii]